MMKRVILLLLVLSLSLLHSQPRSAFDKFGPFGSPAYTTIKDALKSQDKVYRLDLSHQMSDEKELEKLPTLIHLQALQFRSNNITAYPAGFENLRNLCYFASFDNRLTRFPPNLRNYQLLQHIEIYHSAIDSIPEAVAYLNRLQTLRLGGTGDSLRLPASLPYLKKLQEVSLENYVLDSVPSQLFAIPSLRFLYLTNTNTHGLPKGLEKMTSLEVLVIENNPLSRLPFSIYQLRNLRILSLRGTRVDRLPDSISQLENLTILDLRGTLVNQEEIEKLKALLPGCEIRY
jgi:Leucine-rich repeat (LRR) protein